LIFNLLKKIANTEDIRRKYNPMVTLSKSTSKKDIKWSCRLRL